MRSVFLDPNFTDEDTDEGSAGFLKHWAGAAVAEPACEIADGVAAVGSDGTKFGENIGGIGA